MWIHKGPAKKRDMVAEDPVSYDRDLSVLESSVNLESPCTVPCVARERGGLAQ